MASRPDADAAPEAVDPFEDDHSVDGLREETMVINMGPQHPSTHGVLRLVLELDGETVVSCQPVVGYLHTGIEKNCEWRSWQQGVAFVTRMDYLSPFHNEMAYCLAVERLLVEAIPADPRPAMWLTGLMCGLRPGELGIGIGLLLVIFLFVRHGLLLSV